MKIGCVSLIYLTFFLSSVGCNSKDCYQLLTPQDSILVKRASIILDQGIVASIDEVQQSENASLAKFCLPEAVRIPKNSKVYVGFIKPYDIYGVVIMSSKETEFINADEQLHGQVLDTIQLTLPDTDTVLVNKVI